MPSYSGVWTLTAQYQAVGSGNWTGLPQTNTALIAGGDTGSGVGFNTINYVNISTLGNATVFGQLSSKKYSMAAAGSATSAYFFGGQDVTGGDQPTNVIEYTTFATTGTVADFGDLISPIRAIQAANSTTRAYIVGGSSLNNVIQYITMTTSGNAADFGDLTYSMTNNPGCCSSPTRGLIAGGQNGATRYSNIDYITIATTGNATSFGNLTLGRYNLTASGSATRGIFFGGEGASSTNIMDYVTIASAGNAIDFGDLLYANYTLASSSNATRSIISGDYATPGSPTNLIQYVTIASTGNALDFGDLTYASAYQAGCSGGNGGLQ